MKQQTAVDWLVNELKQFAFIPEHHIGMGDIRITQGYLDELAEQAKQMEKEQIIDAFKSGLKSPYHQDYTIVTQIGQEETKSGQYYNETYTNSHNK